MKEMMAGENGLCGDAKSQGTGGKGRLLVR